MKPIEKPYFWQYPAGTIPDILIEDTIKLADSKQREDGKVLDGSIDKNIRSVERTPLDEFDPIGVFMFGCSQSQSSIV